MGGQACVLYGAAEFSRDTDLAILASEANLSRLSAALRDLEAEVIAVPPFEAKYLKRGHAVHFRCRNQDAAGMRVDVMTKMRGVDPFPKLWSRRSTLLAEDGTAYQLMSLPDLVKAKKTQRDKDWPMIRRLVEADYFVHQKDAAPAKVRFWFAELRTVGLLIELSIAHAKTCHKLIKQRPLLRFASIGDEVRLTEALSQEEAMEREADRKYWIPLKAELERLRHTRVPDGIDRIKG